MPKYDIVFKVKLRKTVRNIAAFSREEAEDYGWSLVGGDEGLEWEVELDEFDVDDVEVSAYERAS